MFKCSVCGISTTSGNLLDFQRLAGPAFSRVMVAVVETFASTMIKATKNLSSDYNYMAFIRLFRLW